MNRADQSNVNKKLVQQKRDACLSDVFAKQLAASELAASSLLQNFNVSAHCPDVLA